MKLLITGTGGYIGSVATRAFLKAGHEVIGIDAGYRGYKEPQELIQKEFGSDRFRFHTADIKEKVASIIEAEPGIEAVIHFAAYCNVGESEKDPGLYFENNIGAVTVLMDSMKDAGIKKLVFSSTCATYGDPQYIPIDEKHPLGECASPYGESKLLAERVIKWYSKLYDLNCVTLRYFNICGASDDSKFGDSKKPSFHLMQNAVRASLGLGEFKLNFTEVDTPDKSPIRDYINVEDLADAHVSALAYLAEGGKSNLFNLGTGLGNSVFEIIGQVEKITGVTFEKNIGERRKGDAVAAVADNRKAKEILGWEPRRSIADSVNSLYKWYKERPEGWTY